VGKACRCLAAVEVAKDTWRKRWEGREGDDIVRLVWRHNSIGDSIEARRPSEPNEVDAGREGCVSVRLVAFLPWALSTSRSVDSYSTDHEGLFVASLYIVIYRKWFVYCAGSVDSYYGSVESSVENY
jgi:hypothetical protein